MQHKKLKLSSLAILIAGATHAHAELYTIEEVASQSNNSGFALDYFDKTATEVSEQIEFYGQAIEPSQAGEDCFATSCNSPSYSVAGESRLGTDGFNYRDEVPYMVDNRHHIDTELELQTHCTSTLGYNTCSTWASQQWAGIDGFGGLAKEFSAWSSNYYASALPLVGNARVTTFANSDNGYVSGDKPVGTLVDSASHVTSNAVVNAMVEDFAIGITSGAFFQLDANGKYARQFAKRGFVTAGEGTGLSTQLLPEQSQDITRLLGQSMAWDAVDIGSNQLLVVGNASVNPFNTSDGDKSSWGSMAECVTQAGSTDVFQLEQCQHFNFVNNAFIWLIDTTAQGATVQGQPVSAIPVSETNQILDDYAAQATARAVAVDATSNTDYQGKPVMAGLNTSRIDNIYVSRAAIFKPKSDYNASTLASSANQWDVSFIPGLDIKSGSDTIYSYTVANDINNNRVVVGNAKSSKSQNRSYALKSFVYDDSKGGNATLFSPSTSSIFFDGSNSVASAINNNNEIVGWVDTETANEVGGRQRRQRAYIYAYGDNPKNLTSFDNQRVWLLDDLTNGGTNANQYRIAQATDINDAGVISATALKCSGGYQSSELDAKCDGDEQIVAVRLVPKAGGDITARERITQTVERTGASFGLFTLTLLGLISFRRKK